MSKIWFNCDGKLLFRADDCVCDEGPPEPQPCTCCSGDVPAQMQITFSGVTGVTAWNATWMVPAHPSLSCVWELTVPGICSGDDGIIRVNLVCTEGSFANLFVDVGPLPIGDSQFYDLVGFVSPIDCTGINDASLSQTPLFAGTCGDFTGATCSAQAA